MKDIPLIVVTLILIGMIFTNAIQIKNLKGIIGHQNKLLGLMHSNVKTLYEAEKYKNKIIGGQQWKQLTRHRSSQK